MGRVLRRTRRNLSTDFAFKLTTVGADSKQELSNVLHGHLAAQLTLDLETQALFADPSRVTCLFPGAPIRTAYEAHTLLADPIKH
jgi:hypothetical protein